MKFHELETGQRFMFQGQVYMKISPMIATREDNGEKKFLRRADSVQLHVPSSVSLKAANADAANIDLTELEKRFDGFFNDCLSLIEAGLRDIPAVKKKKLFSQLQQARVQFLQGWVSPKK